MFQALRPQAALQRKASDIYGAIVTQARHPDFYGRLGVPDTPVGRYEMVVVHLFLVLERLRADPSGTDELARALLETFVADMDDSVREMGTGDVAVGKKVRRAAAGFYERSSDYRAGLAAPAPQDLARVLARHAYGHERGDDHGLELASYVRAAGTALMRHDLSGGTGPPIAFPAPAAAVDLP
jgi:cytochrome b pre-mRNA-processing protein 3